MSFWITLSTAAQLTPSPTACISTATSKRRHLYLNVLHDLESKKFTYTHHLLFLPGGDSRLFEQLCSSPYLWHHAQYWPANVSITPSETSEYESKGGSNVCLLLHTFTTQHEVRGFYSHRYPLYPFISNAYKFVKTCSWPCIWIRRQKAKL